MPVWIHAHTHISLGILNMRIAVSWHVLHGWEPSERMSEWASGRIVSLFIQKIASKTIKIFVYFWIPFIFGRFIRVREATYHHHRRRLLCRHHFCSAVVIKAAAHAHHFTLFLLPLPLPQDGAEDGDEKRNNKCAKCVRFCKSKFLMLFCSDHSQLLIGVRHRRTDELCVAAVAVTVTVSKTQPTHTRAHYPFADNNLKL